LITAYIFSTQCTQRSGREGRNASNVGLADASSRRPPRAKSEKNKKTQLSLGNTRYSLYSSCCSTDLQGYPRSI